MANKTEISRTATEQQAKKFITRHSILGSTPEGRLIIEMIALSWGDAKRSKKHGSCEAKYFFTSGRADVFGGLIGCHIDLKQMFKNHHPNA